MMDGFCIEQLVDLTNTSHITIVHSNNSVTYTKHTLPEWLLFFQLQCEYTTFTKKFSVLIEEETKN